MARIQLEAYIENDEIRIEAVSALGMKHLLSLGRNQGGAVADVICQNCRYVMVDDPDMPVGRFGGRRREVCRCECPKPVVRVRHWVY